MTRAGIFFLFSLICYSSLANTQDSLVRWNELVYGTTAEKGILNELLKANSTDYIRSFLGNAPDPEDSYKRFSDRINSVLSDIESSGQLKKRNERKVKYIEEVVRKRFLSHYEPNSSFFEIMANGNYNSLTATALYACIFEKLSIPYRITESPTEVSIIAYPEKEKVDVDTNAPIISQYRIYNEEFQESYLKFLLARKLITQDELDQYPTESLFKVYFFKDDSLSIKGLAGKHYIHDAYQRLDNNDFTSAYAQAVKGYLYYPSPTSAYTVMIMTGVVLNQPKVNKLTRATLLGRLSRFSNGGITADEIVAEFRQLSQEVVIKNNDRPLYVKCFDAVAAGLNDKVLLDEIRSVFYSESARSYYNQGRFNQAKTDAVHAMDIKKGDDFINTVFIRSLSASFYRSSSSRTIVDSVEFYMNKYPSIIDVQEFQDMLANAYAFDFGTSYYEDDIKRGETYRQKFEGLLTAKKAKIQDPNIVAFAYTKASEYYLRKGQKTKAKEALDRGLELVPGNNELQQRRKQIN